MKIVFVGFKVKQDKSVMYKKIEVEDNVFGKELAPHDTVKVGKVLSDAVKKDCDFVSIRFIKEDK